jgi:hypothetical protein
MNGFNLSSQGGILRGQSFPNSGQYHGQMFELVKDELSIPQLFYWNEILKEWLSFSNGSFHGGIFITDVRPQSTSENISGKVYSDDINVQLESFVTTTSLVTVDILLITGYTHYKPINSTINGVIITNITPLVDRPLFKATMDFDLKGEKSIKVVHEDGAFNDVSVFYNELPKISSVTFASDYPITNGIKQTELKENDSMSINIKVDKDITKVEIADYGSCKSQIFNTAQSTDINLSNVLIADRGNVSQLLGIKLRVQGIDGGWSDWFSSDSLGTVEKINVVNCNNLKPTVTISNITYPTGQQALKNNEQATIINNISNYNTVTYSSPNGDLNINNSNLFEGNKIVNRINGDYNISIINFKITAYRNANGSSTIIDKVINIANTDPVITINEQYARLISAPTGYQSWIKLISTQKLLNTPTLTIPCGIWTNNFTSSDNITFSRNISISDSDIKGIYNYTSISATNLAGKVVTVITGDGSYIVGGFSSRKITFPAFQNTMPIGCFVSDVTKLSVVDLSGYIFTYQSNFDNNKSTFTIVDSNGNLDNKGNYIKLTDQSIVNQNSMGTYWITVGENV